MQRAILTAFGAALFAACSLRPASGEESQADLRRQVDDLERRVLALEQILGGPTLSDAVSLAQASLSAAEEKLQHTERLFQKGFVSKVQLEADRFQVARTRKELEAAKAARNANKLFLEIEVLTAEQVLAIASTKLEFTEKLFKKGFTTEAEVKTNRLKVENARRQLERAKAALKAFEESVEPAAD
jgi:multidrug resistance efflux pump